MRTQKKCLAYVSIVVDDYDEAIEYYTEKLGFMLIEDTPQPGKRWVVIHQTQKAIVICYYQKHLMKRSRPLLAISVVGVFFCFYKPMIFGGITTQ